MIFLFALSFTSLAQTIDLQVSGVGVTTPYSIVLQKLGKPLSKKKGGTFPCGDEMLTLRYQGLIVKLIEANDGTGFIVGSVDVTSPKWSVSGINVGASIKDVQTKFGQLEEKTKKSGLENLSYGMAEGFANFYFRNNKLVKISWEFNIC